MMVPSNALALFNIYSMICWSLVISLDFIKGVLSLGSVNCTLVPYYV